MNRARIGAGARSLAALAAGALLAAGCARTPQNTLRAFDPDSVPEAYARSTAALMAPGATRAMQITPEGDLFNGAWNVRIRPAAGGTPAAAPRAIAAWERRWPVFRWRREAGAVRFDFEAVALPDRAPRDSALLVSVRVEAENRGATPADARVDWTLAPPDSAPLFRVWDFDPAREGAAALAWATSGDAPAHAAGEGTARGTARSDEWRLAPGERRIARIVCATYPTRSATLRAFARVPHERHVSAALRSWNETLAPGLSLELGDPEVERAFDAARVILLSLRERRGAAWVPIGGPFHYRDVWLRDGARAAQALAVAGHVAEARQLADGLGLLQWPHGPFLSQRGQLDGTGQALWAYEQTHLRGDRDTALVKVAASATAAWQWGERQRQFGRLAGWRFSLMLPFGDPRDAELVRAQLVGNDAWLIAGYRATERLLRSAGYGPEADSVARSRAQYERDFRAALALTGRPDVPPSWQNVGRDWGNLSAGYPCRALPYADPRLAALAHRVWREAGGPGLGFYAHTDSLHTYDFADLASWALVTGDRAAAERMLAAMLRWRSASGGAAEMFSGATRDWGVNPPPHGTSAAVLAALIRNTLVFDEDDTLRLTLGAREAWWHGAHVRRAPTWWTTLDLDFGREGAGASWRWTAVPVWTALTLPPGSVLDGPPPAPLVAGRGGTVVLAPPGTREARVRVRAAAAP